MCMYELSRLLPYGRVHMIYLELFKLCRKFFILLKPRTGPWLSCNIYSNVNILFLSHVLER